MSYSAPRILILGASESGKSTLGKACARHLGTKHHSTSEMIVADYAAMMDVSVNDVWKMKQCGGGRRELFDFANDRKRTIPEYYVQLALPHGNVVDGCRTPVELAACRHLFHLVLWKEGGRPNDTDTIPCPPDAIRVPDFGPDDWAGETDIWVGDNLDKWLATPEVYVAGRYRHWIPDGTWDVNAMAQASGVEYRIAKRLRKRGLRVFAPIATHLPLDTYWGEESADRIIAMCIAKVRYMRPRDAIYLRPGWRDHETLPDSEGTWREYGEAKEIEMHVAHGEAGEDAAIEYLAGLLGQD